MTEANGLDLQARRDVYLHALRQLLAERFPDVSARRRWWESPRLALAGQTPVQVCQPGFDPDGEMARILWDLVKAY